MCEAVDRAERGLVDADLGAGLIKQRVGRPGQGRRGGFRTLLAYRAGSRVVFLLGFAKSERDNIGDDELTLLRARAAAFLELSDTAIKARIAPDDMTEVHCGAGEEQE
ncbi:MAG: addiction module toxin RelE [Hyphomicrobium sp.]|nr:MAG: addiction module toxin RelE [Hyphomicrobium sp.]